MSKYIATRAIRGANALVTEAELMLQKALDEKGPNTPVAFPNTAYYLPTIYGMTGMAVDNLGQLRPVMQHARELLHPTPSVRHWTPYLGETLDSGMATLVAAETIEAVRFVYRLQPEPMPGFQLAGGTAFTSPDAGVGSGNGHDGHLNGQLTTFNCDRGASNWWMGVCQALPPSWDAPYRMRWQLRSFVSFRNAISCASYPETSMDGVLSTS
jgi:hypothetical protein